MKSHARRPSINSTAVLLAVGATVAAGLSCAVPLQESAHRGTDLVAFTVGTEVTATQVSPGLTTSSSTTQRQTDATFTTAITAEPSKYQAPDGTWAPINVSLTAVTGDYRAVSSGSDVAVKFPADPDLTPLRIETAGSWLSLQQQGLRASPAIAGVRATYAADDVNQSVQYEARATGVKENIILQRPGSSAPQWTYDINASAGLNAVQLDTGAIEFRDPSNDLVFSVPRGNMTDSAGPEPAYSSSVQYNLSKITAGWRLTVVPDAGWLADASRVYPVTVDPSVETKSPQKDCWVETGSPNANRCNKDFIKVGVDGASKRRGLIDFSIKSLPSDATVTGATLSMWMDQYSTTGSGGATAWNVYEPRLRWTDSATWNSAAPGSWTGGDPGAPVSGDLSMGGESSGFKDWNVTDAVRRWQQDSNTNNGLLIRQVSETVRKSLGFVGSNHPNVGLRPVLTVSYRLPPVTPTKPALVGMSPCVELCQDKYSITNSKAPELIATANDPDSSSLTYSFYVEDFEGDNLVASGQVVAAPGTYARWQVPPGALNDETIYQWKVAVQDGSSTVWNNDYRFFNYNVPVAPTMTSSALLVGRCVPNSCSSSSVLDSDAPTLTATVTDPDSSILQVDFTITPVAASTPTPTPTPSATPTTTPTSAPTSPTATAKPTPCKNFVCPSASAAAAAAQQQVTPATTAAQPQSVFSVSAFTDESGEARFNVPSGVLVDNTSYTLSAIANDGASATPTVQTTFSTRFTSGVRPPTRVSAQDSTCVLPCRSAILNANDPLTFKATTAPTTSDAAFELWDGSSLVATKTFSSVAANSLISWTFPPSLASGEYEIRAGSISAGQTVWSTTSVFSAIDPDTAAAPPDPTATYQKPAVSYSPGFGQPTGSGDPVRGDDEGATRTTPAAAPPATDLKLAYAPILRLDGHDASNPLSATTFISNSTLNWHHEAIQIYCNDYRMVNAPVEEKLAFGDNPTYNRRANPAGGCDPTGPNWRPYDPVSVGTTGSDTPLYGQGMFLDLNNNYRGGSTYTGNEPTYVRVKNKGTQVKWLHYWFNYGQSYFDRCPQIGGIGGCLRIGYHEGDWEHIAVLFDDQQRPIVGKFYYHRESCVFPFDKLPRIGTQLVVDVAKHAHGNYPAGFKEKDWHGIDVDTPPRDDIRNWNTSVNVKKLPQSPGVANNEVPWYGFAGSWGGNVIKGTDGVSSQVSPDGPNPFRNYRPGFTSGGACKP